MEGLDLWKTEDEGELGRLEGEKIVVGIYVFSTKKEEIKKERKERRNMLYEYY